MTRPYAIPHGEPGEGLRAYLPTVRRRRRRPTWPWLLVLVFILGYYAGARVHAADVVTMRVRPQFMIQRRGDIDIQVRIPRSAENRLLSIAWTSDVGSAGSTLRPLEGDDAQVLHTLALPSQPAANYTFVAAVFNHSGKLRGRAEARIHAPGEGDISR